MPFWNFVWQWKNKFCAPNKCFLGVLEFTDAEFKWSKQLIVKSQDKITINVKSQTNGRGMWSLDQDQGLRPWARDSGQWKRKPIKLPLGLLGVKYEGKKGHKLINVTCRIFSAWIDY